MGVRIKDNETGIVKDFTEKEIEALDPSVWSRYKADIGANKMTFEVIDDANLKPVQKVVKPPQGSEANPFSTWDRLKWAGVQAVPGALTGSALGGGIPGGAIGGLVGAGMGFATGPPRDLGEALGAGLAAGIPIGKSGASALANVGKGILKSGAATQGINALTNAVNNFALGTDEPLLIDPRKKPVEFAIGTFGGPFIGEGFARAARTAPAAKAADLLRAFGEKGKVTTITRLSDVAPGLKSRIAGTPFDIEIGSNTSAGRLLKEMNTASTGEIVEKFGKNARRIAAERQSLVVRKAEIGNELAALQIAEATGSEKDIKRVAGGFHPAVREILKTKSQLANVERQIAKFDEELGHYEGVLSSVGAADAALAQKAGQIKTAITEQTRTGQIQQGTIEYDIAQTRREIDKIKSSIGPIAGKDQITALEQKAFDLEMDKIISRSQLGPEVEDRLAQQANATALLEGSKAQNKILKAGLQTAAGEAKMAGTFAKGVLQKGEKEVSALAAGQKAVLKNEKASLDGVLSKLESDTEKFGAAVPASLKKLFTDLQADPGGANALTLRDKLFKEGPDVLAAFQDYTKSIGRADLLPKIREDMLGEIFKKGFDPSNPKATLSAALGEFGPDKLGMILGGDIDKFNRFARDVQKAQSSSLASSLAKTVRSALFYAAPSMFLLGNISENTIAKGAAIGTAVAIGIAWPKLVNAVIRDSKLGDQFHVWIESGATAQALKALPYLATWMKDTGYEFTKAGLAQWGPTKKAVPIGPAAPSQPSSQPLPQ